MKKLFTVIALTLAMNFLALAGGVGWLYQNHRIDREKVMAIKEILFPKPVEELPATQPSGDATTQPTLRLEELLAKTTGRSASEQVEFIQHAFDTQTYQLDLRRREISDLQRQVELAKEQATKDRAALDAREKALQAREEQATRLATDKGFQDSLAVYLGMPPKQVKAIFMGLDDQTVLNYLQAMEPRTAAGITAEFKTDEEKKRLTKILELMRVAQVPTKE